VPRRGIFADGASCSMSRVSIPLKRRFVSWKRTLSPSASPKSPASDAPPVRMLALRAT
jgi:hypothetical protein